MKGSSRMRFLFFGESCLGVLILGMDPFVIFLILKSEYFNLGRVIPIHCYWMRAGYVSISLGILFL